MWKRKISVCKFEYKPGHFLIGMEYKEDDSIYDFWVYFLPCLPLHIQVESFFDGDIDDIPF